MRNQLAKLCNAVSAPVAAIRDALAERFQSVLETEQDDGEYGIWTGEIEKHCGKRSKRRRKKRTATARP